MSIAVIKVAVVKAVVTVVIRVEVIFSRFTNNSRNHCSKHDATHSQYYLRNLHKQKQKLEFQFNIYSFQLAEFIHMAKKNKVLIGSKLNFFVAERKKNEFYLSATAL